MSINSDHSLLPPALLHSQDLDHPDEDIDEVQLEVDGLVDGILGHEAALGHAGVVKDLLHIVESEATKDSKTAVQPDVFSPHQCAGSGGGYDHGGKTRKSNDGNTSEQRATEVHVLVGLGGSANERKRAHETSSVETGACENGRVHEEERGKEGGLGDIEGSPESVLLDVAACCQYVMRGNVDDCTHFCGLVAMVPYIVPMLAARPTPMTSHGLAAMSLKDQPFMCMARAAIPMMPTPRPVCMNVSLR